MTRRPPIPFVLALALISALLTGAPVATAQYMFLDLDGDGVFSGNDTYPPFGEPTVIDLYLVTDQNPDGSPATCPDGTAPDFASYAVNLYAPGAAVTFTNVTNRMPGLFEVVPLVTYPYALSVGYAGLQSLPPGKYLLLSFTVEFGSGCPALAITPASCYSPPGVVTSFGAWNCPGAQGDYVLRMEEDWAGTHGFACLDLPGRWPSLECPGEVSGVEGEPLTIPVTLTDPDCSIHSFWVWGLPPGASVSALSSFVAGEASAAVTWTPTVGQAGTYTITFDASDYPGPFHQVTQRDTCSTRITIRALNAAPTAEAGGPYSGIQGSPVAFDGTGSSDPEGGALEFAWDCGDGGHVSGPTPTHTYATGGSFAVALTVTDPGGLTGRDGTTASIAAVLPVRVFARAGNLSTARSGGKPFTCFQIEPLPEAPFAPEQLVLASLRIRHRDDPCGAPDAVPVERKSSRVGDTDRNGVLEVESCFGSESLSNLVSCLAPGGVTVPLVLSGTLANGDRIHGEFSHAFTSRPGALAAAISPNPLNAASVLEFTTRSAGFARARLFDIHGKLVATLMDEPSAEAGYHRVPLTGYDRVGARLASGVYFVIVTTEHDGSERRMVTILR